ncbi:MAG: beta-propeller domain-containing protein [Deltaproteobacteria bacterium]|nr:beta-propeller domain-containing protein [Deltaproteobacteria bacterium]
MLKDRELKEALGMFVATSMVGVVVAAFLMATTGCGRETTQPARAPGRPVVGDTAFVSAAPGGNDLANAGGECAGGLCGTPDASDGRDTGAAREIEEADVIRVVGDRLFLLNAYRGLEIIDISDPDQPSILGNVKIFGYPVEMYVDGGRAYIIVSNYFTYWRGLGGMEDSAVEEWRGSQVVVANIENPALPSVVTAVNIDGYISDTRRVGDILYVVSNRSSWWSCTASDDDVDLTFVASIDIYDPANIHEVERLSFPGSSNFIHVTENAIFVAQYFWSWSEPQATTSYGSTVTYVDISDAYGHVAPRGKLAVPGYLRDRYSMDWFADSFRIVTYFWEGTGHSELRTFDTANPDAMRAQGTLVIADAGQLMATRFAGLRAYTIHLPRQSVDPLDVIDLADPYNPKLQAVLDIPGWVNHIEVRGMRLVALGVDDTDWQNQQVSVKLFDVTDARAPILLDEAPVGVGHSWSTANWDPKALTIVDELGLVLVPYSSWDQAASSYDQGVAIVTWSGDRLTTRSIAATKGSVNRTRATPTRLFATSTDFLEVFNTEDLDQPLSTATLALAWNVADFVVVGDYGVQLVGDYWRYWGDTPVRELRVVPLAEPDAGPVLARISLDAPYGRLFQNGALVTVVSYDYAAAATTVAVFDFADPLHPIARGTASVPMPGGFDYYGGLYNRWGWYYGGGEIIALGDKLAIHPSGYYYPMLGDAAPGTAGASGPEVDQLFIVDLANPDALTSTRVPLEQFATQLSGRGDTLYYTYWEPVQVAESPYPFAAYYLGRVRLDGGVTVLPGVNIPGYFVDAAESGLVIYTVDLSWTDAGALSQSFNALALRPAEAELVGRLDLAPEAGHLNGVTVKSGVAYLTRQTWSNACDVPPRMTLSLVNAAAASTLPTLGELTADGYGFMMAVDSGRAFFNMGWGEGMMVVDTRQPATPRLLSTFRTQGYPVAVRVAADTAYLPSGYYGVQAFRLDDGLPL